MEPDKGGMSSVPTRTMNLGEVRNTRWPVPSVDENAEQGMAYCEASQMIEAAVWQGDDQVGMLKSGIKNLYTFFLQDNFQKSVILDSLLLS